MYGFKSNKSIIWYWTLQFGNKPKKLNYVLFKLVGLGNYYQLFFNTQEKYLDKETDSIRVDKEYQAYFMEIESVKIKIDEISRDKLSRLRYKCYQLNYLYESNI